MITFLELGKLGRLGNQLYQYAALRGISEKTGLECKVPNFNLEWKETFNKYPIKS